MALVCSKCGKVHNEGDLYPKIFNTETSESRISRLEEKVRILERMGYSERIMRRGRFRKGLKPKM